MRKGYGYIICNPDTPENREISLYNMLDNELERTGAGGSMTTEEMIKNARLRREGLTEIEALRVLIEDRRKASK